MLLLSHHPPSLSYDSIFSKLCRPGPTDSPGARSLNVISSERSRLGGPAAHPAPCPLWRAPPPAPRPCQCPPAGVRRRGAVHGQSFLFCLVLFNLKQRFETNFFHYKFNIHGNLKTNQKVKNPAFHKCSVCEIIKHDSGLQGIIIHLNLTCYCYYSRKP